MTDANLCLGRILPEYFPHIFGETENLPLDKEASIKSFQKMRAEVSDQISWNNFLKEYHSLCAQEQL